MKRLPALIGLRWLMVLGFVLPLPQAGAASEALTYEPFSFSITCDMRNFCGQGTYDTSQYFRGVCETIGVVGPGAFMISPGDIDPPWDVYWTVQTYLGTEYQWYPNVGNHESETPEDMVWLRDFNLYGTTLPYIVNVGPAGTQETTFSFDYEDAHFVVINEYYDGVSDVGIDGDVVDALYYWLEADLQATAQPRIFVIGHEPAYVQPDIDNGRLRHVGDSLDQYPAHRDRFWSLLAAEGVIAYFCGHTHNFSYINIDGVWQVDAGHARGVGDTGAASTFVMVYVDQDQVSFDAYRDNYDGGPYSIKHSIIMEGTGVPTPTPTFTPAPPTVTPTCSTSLLLESGTVWKYLDDGSDQGTAWTSVLFDDSSWAQGPSQLGYGDGDEATVVGYGPDPNTKYVTTYFRTSFHLDNPYDFVEFELQILRDDGAVVYLNGLEVARSNMTSDPITYLTFATEVIGDEQETLFHSYYFNPNQFQAGTNVLAVEVHQVNLTSSDLSFDCRVLACGLPSTPTLTPTVTPTATPLPYQVAFISEGSMWKYLDDGTDQASAWMSLSFDDNAWSEGPSQLGYGDGDEATIVGYGPDSGNKYITTYFRHEFNLTDPLAFEVYYLDILRDDGAVVYLNGVEIYRTNLPTETITYQTLALVAIGDAEELVFHQISLAPTQFQTGLNVLAVEIHQVSGTSSDISFDCWLFGHGFPPTPTETATPSPTPSPTPTQATQKVLLIGEDSEWHYLDDGTDQGAAWRQLAFDDQAWSSGYAQLGYGDGDEATLVNYGPDPDNKYPTTYFRKTFTIPNPALCLSINIWTLRDDGAVVYVNGNEVHRSNLPEGLIEYATYANSEVENEAENQFYDATCPPSLLVAGTNLVAVEVHQASAASPDLSFNFKMNGMFLATVTPTPIPTPEATFTPSCINHGDVNFDGFHTAGDAQLTIYYVVNLITPDYGEACAADCNGDGELTAGDAQTIFGAALALAQCVDPL